jgi:hypothetical protein
MDKIDYARLCDMTEIEIGLNYCNNLFSSFIEKDITDDVLSIRNTIVDYKKRKTQIKSLRKLISNDKLTYYKNLIDDIYDKSYSNSKSVRNIIKKTIKYIENIQKAILSVESSAIIDSYSNDNPYEAAVLIKQKLQTYITFFQNRLDYYNNALIDYTTDFKWAKDMKQAIMRSESVHDKYCDDLLSSLSVEEEKINTNIVELEKNLMTNKTALKHLRENIYIIIDNEDN